MTRRSDAEVVPFRCDVARDGNVERIVLAGELDLDTAGKVEPLLRENGVQRRVLDLSELTFMDSSGLRLILSAHSAARREGSTLQIVPGPPAVQRVFQICGVEDDLLFLTT